ncbi:gamma-glutamylcyclotransferase [Sphingobium sp. DEHP117]|uniref:gamma-glutamylcyclotransferase family protein n=1 Tax=Sphingobium sp. DEHP117 TaxID=2993436 RepID=UPI0027D6195B|nr:gamma-glutamylcyclotransferase [Sphingobium sp. DEHP117]MDQ4419233.1 gamma-glutamylcyclotransferase [Sphingobium sp. DEHP117]
MRHRLATSDSELLFVYGTLRRGCDNQQAHRLHSESSWLGTGLARGRLYRVDWYPALVADQEAGWVAGDILRMADPDATLAWLDAYEECGPAFPQPQEYRREPIDIVFAGAQVRAWAYLYNRPLDGLKPVPDGDWLSGQSSSADPVDQPDCRE